MNPSPINDPAALRLKAEARLKARSVSSSPPHTGDLLRMHHELSVHQIELEMQNAELQVAHGEITAAMERYSDHFDFAPVGFFNLSIDGTIQLVNLAGAKMLGIERAELLGRRFGLFVDESRRLDFPDFLMKVFASGTKQTCEITVGEPGESSLDGLLEATLSPDGTECRAVLVDITHRKQAEMALRESEQRFRQVTENIDEVFWLTNVGAPQMIYVSPAYEKIWGRTCESLYADPQSWLNAIHPEDKARITDATHGLQAGESYDVEYRILRPDGTLRWIQDRAFFVKEATGSGRRIAGVAIDITGRRQLEDQFRQAQKMEAIGQLAGGIAHDFNNLLAVIQMQSSLLMEKETDARYLKEGLQKIIAASERAANLTRQLLTFSRRGVRQVKVMDLGEVADHMVKLLTRVIGDTIAINTVFAPSRPLINADPGMMEQILMNLAVNARDAMPGGGTLNISVDVQNIDVEAISTHPKAVPGEYVRLSVGDTGGGIAPENLERIFEPFFTTKEVGKGTGLGLATVFGIVELHHGWIEVASEVGHGTTFNVFLPALPSATSRVPQVVEHNPHSTGGSETILLVEDEQSVRNLARAVLERYGYRVLEASSAAEALRCWKSCNGKIDRVLTDMVMPGGISGLELVERLTRIEPGLKVIYTSGYNPEMEYHLPQVGLRHDFLQKPYSVSDLSAIVRCNLDKTVVGDAARLR